MHESVLSEILVAPKYDPSGLRAPSALSRWPEATSKGTGRDDLLLCPIKTQFFPLSPRRRPNLPALRPTYMCNSSASCCVNDVSYLRIEEHEFEAGQGAKLASAPSDSGRRGRANLSPRPVWRLGASQDPPGRALLRLGLSLAAYGTPCPTQVPPSLSLFVPSGQMVWLYTTPCSDVSLVIVARKRLAPLRLAW